MRAAMRCPTTMQRHDPRTDCPTFCEACRTDRTPIAVARDYKPLVSVRRPVCQENPGSPHIPEVDPDSFEITTVKP